MPAKKIGKETRQVTSIRLEPKVKNKLCKKYGSVQKWVDIMIDKSKTKEVKNGNA